MYGLMAGIGGTSVILAVDVAVKHGKTHEKCDTNEVFHAFNV
jgi:hypothetical protein